MSARIRFGAATVVLATLLLGPLPATAGPPVRPVPGPGPGPGPGPAPGSAAAPAVVTYAAPVPQPFDVLRPFDPPSTPYGPGHLGVDLRLAAGRAVRAAADGVVRFAGQVAGRGVVVLAHPDGIVTEYEPIRPALAAGARVVRGEVIGTLAGQHPGCPAGCLHWGARRGSEYLDPLDLLRPLGPVVLLPWAGDP